MPKLTEKEIIDMFEDFAENGKMDDMTSQKEMWMTLCHVTSDSQIISAAEHDKIYLFLTFEDLVNASEEDFNKIMKSSVFYDENYDCFAMFV